MHEGREARLLISVTGSMDQSFFIGSEGAVPIGIGVGFQDMLPRRDQKPSGTASRIENGLGFLRVDDRDHEVDDMAWCAEVPGRRPRKLSTESKYSNASPRRSEWSRVVVNSGSTQRDADAAVSDEEVFEFSSGQFCPPRTKLDVGLPDSFQYLHNCDRKVDFPMR